jgi:phospholipid/cholesterol/gamma-HCH transport system permease protein
MLRAASLLTPFARLARWLHLRLGHLGELSALFYRLLRATCTGPGGHGLLRRETARVIYLTGFRGGPVVALTALFLGLLVIVHATQQLMKIQGEEFIGKLLVIIVVREVGPILTAFFVLLRSGTAITAEIATLTVTREYDALIMQGIDPDRYLGVPRFWGLTISLLALYILSLFTAILGGFLFAQMFAEIYWQGFWLSLLNALDWPDLVVGFAKALLFGMIIGAVSFVYGLRTAGRLRALARESSRSAVLSLILCGGVNALLDVVFYL